VSGRWDPQVEQWLWQRRAAAELVAILKAHPDLPSIAWTVGPTGCGLTGQVTAAGASAVGAMFHGWRAGLGLGEYTQTTGQGICYLQAAQRRDRIRVMLTATVHDDGGEPA
jgi:hypothetical protein